MGYPCTGLRCMYRNSLVEVKQFLDKHHKDHYYVINLTENKYNSDLFEEKVLQYGFPDHHSPQFDTLFSVVLYMDIWMKQNKNNVMAVHCLAGKGRTGVVIVCYLIYDYYLNSEGDISDPDEIYKIFSDLFTKNRGEGIEYKNQSKTSINFAKYCYFLKMTHNYVTFLYLPPPEIIIKYIKTMTSKYTYIIKSIDKENKYKMVYNSKWCDHHQRDDSNLFFYYGIFHLKLDVNTSLRNEIYLEIRENKKTLCWIYYNTRFIPCYENSIKFTPDCFDTCGHNVKLIENFEIEIFYGYKYG